MSNTTIHKLIVQSQNVNWTSSAWVLTATALVLLFAYSTRRTPFPSSAPPVVSEDWPIVGAFRFFVARAAFLRDGAKASKTGNFSFFIGKHRVVGISSTEGKRTFYESKDLSSHQG